MSNNSVPKFSAGHLQSKIEAELFSWDQENKTKRLWEKEPSLWTNKEENKWMGWLTLSLENSEVNRIADLTNEIKAREFSDVVLLGMGGSSLCPEMMTETFGHIEGYPKLHILDSTNPDQIYNLEKKIDLKKTFSIVSSKSGSTLEPNIYKEYFFTQLQKVLKTDEVGDRFIAITDPGTVLETLARKDKFKAVFYGIPSIGGRYSALSNFGLVPSGIMGVNLSEFLQNFEIMQSDCGPHVSAQKNPGVVLGVVMGVCAKAGKDKQTLVCSPGIHSLGAWLEQLIAESTGKEGKGLIPIDQESLGEPSVYSDDRIFVYIRLDDAFDIEQDRAIDKLEKSGFVVVKISMSNKMHLGAELFRWEVATAVAGSIIGIDPFNQPDVEDSKVISAKLASVYEKTGEFNEQKAFYSEHNINLASDDRNETQIKQNLSEPENLTAYLKAHLDRLKPNDYVNISAFIEMNTEHTKLLQEIQTIVRDRRKVATCFGFGPRFLHSTGQAYKGGPNSGVFFQLVADATHNLDVPNHKYSFGFVIKAQAQGDFMVLAARERRVLRLYLGKDVNNALKTLLEIFKTVA